MDAFISRKRRCVSPPQTASVAVSVYAKNRTTVRTSTEERRKEETHEHEHEHEEEEEQSTDVKLAILSSLHPDKCPEDLLEILLSCEGSVDDAVATLALLASPSPSTKAESTSTNSSKTKNTSTSSNFNTSTSPRRPTAPPAGLQSALPFGSSGGEKRGTKPLTKKGKTLHLYTPKDIAQHTPCSIIHNFLPPDVANALLDELLAEVPSYESIRFKIFDQVVKSPHTACFYVDSLAAVQRQRSEYYYNGNDLGDIRQILPVMRQVSDLVGDAVNKEIAIRIRDFYPGGQKLQYQTPKRWQPNAAFVNCYDGGAQHVGYHSDQLSYLGPRAVIGSLSLGVAREFRVRRIVPKESDGATATTESEAAGKDSMSSSADLSGQIAIHLPHNSLLVMHAEMQEEWKHSIAPAPTVTPHPRAGNKRINITYRWYREEFRPKFTPKCRCGVPCVLKTVQKQKATRGRYMWMCQVGNRPEGGEGCGWFEWAWFTDDGVPVGWKGDGDGNGGDSAGRDKACTDTGPDRGKARTDDTRPGHDDSGAETGRGSGLGPGVGPGHDDDTAATRTRTGTGTGTGTGYCNDTNGSYLHNLQPTRTP